MQGNGAISFLRRATKFGAGRLAFTLSPEIQRLISPDQVYQVTIRPVGTLTVKFVPGSPFTGVPADLLKGE